MLISKAKGAEQTRDLPIQALSVTLRGHGSETADLWKEWHGTDPGLLSLVTVAPHSCAQIVATVARLRSTLLCYWVGPDSLYIWVVTPRGDIHMTRLAVNPARLARLVRETVPVVSGRSAGGTDTAEADSGSRAGRPTEKRLRSLPLLRGGDLVAFEDRGREAWLGLHRLLIAPVRRHLPPPGGARLTIVPHGPLFRVSFAALLDEKGRYLLEKYQLHYAPSSAALEFSRRKKQAGGTGGYLLVADPTLPSPPKGKKPLPPLPGAQEEVKAIARSLALSEITLLVGAQAQEAAVRSALPGKRVVHLATHGIVRDDRPLDSFLALGGASRDTPNDGRLTAQEIYGLDLDADLVVLSGCRTGLGKSTGDSIAVLARAFIYAGTPSLVVTLWDVADETSMMLLPEFYRAHQRGFDHSRALQAAQLHLLRDLRRGGVQISTPAGTVRLPEHPFFWAAFALLGEP